MAVQESFNTGKSISGNIEYLFNQKDKDFTISDVYAAVTSGGDTLYKRAAQSDKKLDLILSAITMSNSHLATIEAGLLFGNGGSFDQAALLNVELTATGDAKDFMHSLTELAKLDDIQLLSVANGLDNISDSLDKILKKDYSNIDPILASLTALTQGLAKFTSSLPSFKTFGGIAAGIALMGLTISAFISVVSFDEILKLGLIFGGIALTSKLLEGVRHDLISASFGIATMGLSIWAFNKLIDAPTLLNFSASLLTLGAAVWAFDKGFSLSSANVGESLASLALGVGVLGVSLIPYKMVEWESIGKASVALGGIALASLVLNKAKYDAKDALKLSAISLATGVLGVSLMAFNSVSKDDVGVALLALAGITGIGFLVGKLKGNILTGALALGGIGIAMSVIAYGIDQIRQLDMTLNDAVVVASTIGLTAAAMAGLGAIAPLIGLGALAALGMGVGLATLSYGLNRVSETNLTEAKAEQFSNSLMLVKGVLTSLGETGGFISLAKGMVQSALIAGATIPLVLATNMVSKVKIPNDKTLEGFDKTIIKLKDVFTQFGFMDLAELAAVTPDMLLMATTTVALGGAINLFTKLSTSETAADDAVSTLDTFLVGIHSTFAKHDDASFDILKKGIDSTMGIGTLLKNLSTGVSAVSVHLKKNTDFKSIGESVGEMLHALTSPLEAIGGKSDEIMIGGFSITNPFSNKVEKGIDALKNIGSVFTPLSDILNVFAKDDKKTLVSDFKTNIKGILGTLSEVFLEYKDMDSNDGMQFMFKATDNASSFVRTISESKYEHASKGLSSISKSTKLMQTSINDMDLTKLSKLNDLFHNMNMLQDGDGMEELIKALSEFVEVIMKQGSESKTENNKTVVVNKEENNVVNKGEKSKGDTENPIAEILAQGNGDIVQSIIELTQYLKSGDLSVTANIEQEF